MKQDIIIRADGGTSIGMGHIVRCLALADMLKEHFSISFAVQEPGNPVIEMIRERAIEIIALPQTSDFEEDFLNFQPYLRPEVIVILDGYGFTARYQNGIKRKGCKLVYIDDLHSWRQVADVVINHAEGISPLDYEAEDDVRFCLGSKYAMLRKPFLANTESRKHGPLRSIFISMGAADKDNLTWKFTEALLDIRQIEEIHLMLGAVNPHLQQIRHLAMTVTEVKISIHINIDAAGLRQLLERSDLAICPASTIALEACAVGIGLLSGFSADNQKSILKGLKSAEVLKDLGDLQKIGTSGIKLHVESLIKEPDQISGMIQNQKKLIDGRSPDRLKSVFEELKNEKLHFRFAEEKDAMLYFKWTNDPVVRANSFQQHNISLEHHLRWFHEHIHDPDYYFYLFLDKEGSPAGQVRISRDGVETTIGISVDENFRGQSLAPEMIRKASRHYLARHPEEKVSAYIKIENTASYKSFIKAGFITAAITDISGCKSYKLERKDIYE